MIYIFFAIFSLFSLILSRKTKNKKFFLAVSFILLFIISALRYNVGTDYNSYVVWFNNITEITELNDIGFNIIIMLIKLLNGHSQWMFVISSFLILFFVYKSCYENQKYYDLSLFLFITLLFYFSSFNTLRQWIATAIIMYAIKYIEKKEFKKFFVLVLIASSFHLTALLMLFMYFILNVKFKNKTRIITILSFFIFSKAIDWIKIITNITQMFFPLYYQRYIVPDSYLLTAKAGSFFPILLATVMFVFYIVFKKNVIKENNTEKYNFKINLCMVVLIFSIINTIGSLFARVSAYFLPLIILLIPDVLLAFDKKSRKIIYIAIALISFVFMIYSLIYKNSYDPLPYQTIFNIK